MTITAHSTGTQRSLKTAESSKTEEALLPLSVVEGELIKDLVKGFKLLSDATRLQILFFLMRHGELHVRALCMLLGQSQPAVSHHLGMLRVAGMIEPRREGKHSFYHIVPGEFEHFLDTFFDAMPHEGHRLEFHGYVLTRRPRVRPK